LALVGLSDKRNPTSNSSMAVPKIRRNLFTPIEKRRAFEAVSDKIKGLIFDGTLKVGNRLPSETDLANQFKVGRQTVREALRLLELSGFITIKKGGEGGPTISNTILDTISDLLLDAIRMRTISIDELTTARIEIEKIMLEYVIRNADDADVKGLQENVRKAKEKIRNNNLAVDDNIQFHKMLAEASKNRLFVIIVESLMVVVGDFLSRLKPDLKKSSRVVEDHEKLLSAIKAGQKSEAITLLERHLMKVKI
jgi:GntR family transcriptional repressor for pyruvate dehydrogenase complex